MTGRHIFFRRPFAERLPKSVQSPLCTLAEAAPFSWLQAPLLWFLQSTRSLCFSTTGSTNPFSWSHSLTHTLNKCLLSVYYMPSIGYNNWLSPWSTDSRGFLVTCLRSPSQGHGSLAQEHRAAMQTGVVELAFGGSWFQSSQQIAFQGLKPQRLIISLPFFPAGLGVSWVWRSFPGKAPVGAPLLRHK